MTWAALIIAPLVIVYQAWTYWVFRQRISAERIPAADRPGEARVLSEATRGPLDAAAVAGIGDRMRRYPGGDSRLRGGDHRLRHRLGGRAGPHRRAA